MLMKDRKTREISRDKLLQAVALILNAAKLQQGTAHNKKLLQLASDVELVADTLDHRYIEA